MSVRIKESPRSRIVISALQVVQPSLCIVEIPTVSKGVVCSENGALQRRVAGCNGCCAVAPCVVGVGADLLAVFRVNSYNIAEDVFLKVECVKYACGIARLTNQFALYFPQSLPRFFCINNH